MKYSLVVAALLGQEVQAHRHHSHPTVLAQEMAEEEREEEFNEEINLA